MRFIFVIVEGHGDVQAAPILFRRVLHEGLGRFHCKVLPPYRMPRSKIGQFGEDLFKAVRLGIAKIEQEGSGGVIVLADADNDCPIEMSERFARFVNDRGIAFPVGLVLARREYEAWFLASAEHMRNHEWVRDQAVAPQNPEDIRDAKGYFENNILNGAHKYSETIEQAKFSAQIHFDSTMNSCRSFRKLYAEIDRMSLECAPEV